MSDDAGLARLNALPRAEAIVELMQVCGAHLWAEAMASARPFPDRDILYQTADAVWNALAPADWLEAFQKHPRIGERAAHDASARSREWSEEEQSAAGTSDTAVRAELAALNRAYEERFGHVFLICASGLSAAAILHALRERIGNGPGEELRAAAEEQRKITRIRLEKLQ